MKQSVLVLGSTGSIGRQTIETLLHARDRFSVVGLSAHSDTETLLGQARLLKPRYLACETPIPADALPAGVTPIFGADASTRLAEAVDADVTVLAISGFAALKPLLAAMRHGKRIAIANKESLVCGGDLVDAAQAAYGATLLPIDSEQSALFQCLQNGRRQEVKRLILTASGGPFFRNSRDELKDITPEQAVAHPTWRMGKKISLDSATLCNKGLEIMEAARLFGFGADEIGVLIHPQSIVHSLVEYRDNTVMAQLSVPDMRLPIQYALTYPDRVPSLCKPLSLADAHALEFYPVDEARFPAIRLAYDCLRCGGGCPVVYNGANERAAELFFDGAIPFLAIEACVERALSAYQNRPMDAPEAVWEADAWARRFVSDEAGKLRNL